MGNILNHLHHLEQQHRNLDKNIKDMENHYYPDDQVREHKKLKLLAKTEIEKIKNHIT